jgi:heavy metal sensor kinase
LIGLTRLPIRWRLTVWYGALLAAALFIFAVGLYFVLRQILYDNFEESLRARASLVLANVRTDPNLTLEDSAVASLRDDEHFVRLIAKDGTVLLDTSETVGGIPMSDDQLASALSGQTPFTLRGFRDGTMGIVTSPVRSGDSILGALQVGESRGDVDEVLRAVLIALAIAAPIVLVLAAVGGYTLAGRALAPVSTITPLAAGIGENDLHARLNLPVPDDELGRLASTFDAMLARIEDAFERQRRFTGDAAHELRTPLSLMRSQVDLALSRHRTTREYEEALQGLDGDLERLTGLVGTLLTLTRADTAQLQIERESFDLAETVGLVVEQYAPIAQETGVDLQSEASAAPYVGDEDLLVQVLVNLLDNAFSHTPAGGIITVGCASNGECRIWVTDTGSGIEPEHQARVFDRFYRIDTGRTRERGGTGLGLSISRAIVEAHQGTITLTSELAKGTRVDIRLPNVSAHRD